MRGRPLGYERLTADDMTTLGMILCTNGLPRLQRLSIYGNGFGDAGMQALCEGHFIAASLIELDIEDNDIGPAGAEALAAALHRGAMPKLETLWLSHNPISNQGVAVLAAPLRKLPALWKLHLSDCIMDDEGVTSLMANLGKDDFKKLAKLTLSRNKITDVGCASIMREIDAGGLPAVCRVIDLDLDQNDTSDEAIKAMEDSLVRRGAEPYGYDDDE